MDLTGFFRQMIKLKEVRRKGWVIRDVKGPESVADHSFILSFLCYVYGRKLGLDAMKCLKMGMIHDICEVHTGDIIYGIREEDREMSLEEKREKEREGFERIVSLLPGEVSKEFRDLYQEFEQGKTKESRLVKDLDKLEMCMQAAEYSGKGYRGLERFFEDGDRKIRNPEIRKAFRSVREGYLKMKGQ